MSLEFVQVAFAGHNRPQDLGDQDAASEGLTKAFELLPAAGITQARLFTGLAQGADSLALEAWRAQALGPVHAVYPFLEPEGDPAMVEPVRSATWLDGDAAEAAGRNPHLAQTRWLISAADLLVVIWNGQQARGAGGTADAVRLALEHQTPVLWIPTPWTGTLLLIRPEHLDEGFGFLELLEQLRHGQATSVIEATPDGLRDALSHVSFVVQPIDEDPPSPRLKPLWRTYANFRRLFGGVAPRFEQLPAPPDLQAQVGFKELSDAQQAADAQASQLGAIHRSQQIILLALAIASTTAMSASAIWPKAELDSVGAELLFAFCALLIWHGSERGRRHERWGSLRRLAEDLRLERAAWTVGVSTTLDGGDLSAGAPARHIRRLAGLPDGRFDQQRVRTWGRWVIDELVLGQVAYHRGQALINGRIVHRTHQLENGSFVLLMIILMSYFVTSLVQIVRSGEPPHWLTVLVMIAGSLVPAIAAAILALEATLSLAEQARRSDVLAQRLKAIDDELGPSPSLEAVQTAVKRAIRLARAQEEHWLESAGRRRLYRAG